jgi:UDP-2,3-diacylglucosamine pyrophosphatase LpxH
LEPNQDDISRIVLLGDILDLWRNSNSQVLLQNLDVLEQLGRLDMMKNYLAGNHDYAVFSLLKQSSVQPDSTGVLDQVSETLELTHDGHQLKFMHGHQIDYWPSLRFYETFSKAMCFVDMNDEELSDVWVIINQFAEDLSECSRSKLNSLTHEAKIAFEQKLAGPLESNAEGEKKGLRYEWDLLCKISDFEDVSKRSRKPLKGIEQFAGKWEKLLDSLDTYRDFPIPPRQIANQVHEMRRIAADLSVGLSDEQFLIRGHGHTPYVHQESMVADAGCWIGERGSYLRIIDGQVSVHKW